tara:strand:+ start:278 stop:550 length:273 start_codon:yes stop_codon:yes gene_type:complete
MDSEVFRKIIGELGGVIVKPKLPFQPGRPPAKETRIRWPGDSNLPRCKKYKKDCRATKIHHLKRLMCQHRCTHCGMADPPSKYYRFKTFK